MGREVRMVPAGWEHPKDAKGHFVPLFEANFAERLAEWELGNTKWAEGLREDYSGGWKPIGDVDSASYEEWTGEKPVESNYMPAFPEGTATNFMMYETCTEGTPISPVFATPEELAHWLADNEASSFGDMTASYEAWLRVCNGGFAPSAVFDSKHGLRSGVEMLAEGE